MRKQYGLKFEEEMIARVDATARATGMTRTAYVEAAILRALDGPASSKAASSAASHDRSANIVAAQEYEKRLKSGGKRNTGR